MKTTSVVALAALLAAAGLIGCQTQSPASASGSAADLVEAWNYVGGKLTDMAEDFPEDKYDYRPTPEVRSFGEHLLHVAGVSYFFIRAARGEEPGSEHLPEEEKYKTKADIAAELKQSFAEVAAAIEQAGDAGMGKSLKHPFAEGTISQHGLWLMAVENAGEHYGSLVVYYRLNGLVPPVSRRPAE
jgi:uncharacterized damage-inducible protein DinB